ncbi:hypothetical protein AKJ65_06380 [candidate division MSBL1 archaeon SCGC-AAA259E19]|uniref:Uncharacterized protein n=2 Tax=candidate division MSBL1 TaxID=215777 RepID=A0A133V5T9_9EURY|nr:hypothetical protein AKJ65_06380 [candidate division MSBL1 archaeon SCGC-AAA259E19]KXB01810.1 hypothetical protein AKJ41_00080 [candidate division MSBL1 archaeon SCGC-AAA259O05]
MPMEIAIMPLVERLVPYAIPFLIGLVCGLLVKTFLKLAVGILALSALLSWGGYAEFPSVRELFGRAQSLLPELFRQWEGWIGTLPFTAPPFIIGLLIGIWVAG